MAKKKIWKCQHQFIWYGICDRVIHKGERRYSNKGVGPFCEEHLWIYDQDYQNAGIFSRLWGLSYNILDIKDIAIDLKGNAYDYNELSKLSSPLLLNRKIDNEFIENYLSINRNKSKCVILDIGNLSYLYLNSIEPYKSKIKLILDSELQK